MENIPDGFDKMDIILSFDLKRSKIIENKIIRMMLFEHYLLYSKVPMTHMKNMFQFHFYCQPNYKQRIAYRLGALCGVGLHLSYRRELNNQTHVVAEGYPECVRIDAEYIDNNLVVGGRVFSNGEAAHEIKFQTK